MIEESPGVYLCDELSKRGYRVFAHDDLAAGDATPVLEGKVEVSDSIEETLRDASVVIITKAEPSYINLKADEITRGRDFTILIDFWRLRKDLADDPKIQYVPSGICIDSEFGEKVQSTLELAQTAHCNELLSKSSVLSKADNFHSRKRLEENPLSRRYIHSFFGT